MFTIDILAIKDLFNLEYINLDAKTESFQFQYYLYYLLNHNTDTFMVKDDSKCIGYMIGKHEGDDENYHAHVTALSVCYNYRSLGIGKELMKLLEFNANVNKAYFTDFFVRKSNFTAIKFYEKNNYVIYREIIEYYLNPGESALDMRKALEMDKDKKSIIPVENPVHANDIED